MDTHCWLLLHREGLHALRSCNYRFYVIKCLAFMQSPCVGHGLAEVKCVALSTLCNRIPSPESSKLHQELNAV